MEVELVMCMRKVLKSFYNLLSRMEYEKMEDIIVRVWIVWMRKD